ncbi:unnamed protein product [Rotaria sp. Silwood1]|nr:unnamed protein product [Rotaria sp. Silwood1]
MDITQKIDAQMLKNVTYKKLLPFMMLWILSVLFFLISDQYMQTRSILDKSLNNFFLNIERLGTRDLLSYAQLSYDTILISIQSNTKLPLTVNKFKLREKQIYCLERLLIIGQYPKNDVWRLYEIRARIYTLLQRPNENTNSLKNEHVNEEQRMIHSSSIISSSDNILVELVAE